MKVYLPPPGGPFGLVYRIVKDDQGRLYLDHLAFGMRHQPPGSKTKSVYQVAHLRLHG
jgi:hypothetical protein